MSTAPSPVDLQSVVRRHERALRRFLGANAARLVRDRESVSDLVQTVFRELCSASRPPSFPGDAQCRRWLLTTARNKLRDRVRFHLRARRDARREATAADAPQAVAAAAALCRRTPSAALISTEELLRIDRSLARLSPLHREVILLRRDDNLSAAAIGAAIGRGEGAARALLSRALARLSALLQE